MARIICLSDTHSLHEVVRVPPGDLLIHAGDHCNHGTSGEVKRFDRWLGTLPHPHKLMIAGNHDVPWQRRSRYARLWLHHAHYLQDRGTEVLGFKIWGSPWQPDFPQWAFYQPRNSPELAYLWEKIPDDTEILITHVPPAGILDFMTADGPSGCAQLLARISRLKHLKLHVFGHVHSGYGRVDRAMTTFVNASICNESYEPVHSPIEILL